MLSKLFGSNARVKILKQFLFNPDGRFYIRQLARDLSLQVNSVRRELENLEKFGLLRVETADDVLPEVLPEAAAKEKKYFRVNKNFSLYNDIKGLIAKSQLLYKDEFSRNLQKVGEIKLLLLTGVFVNNFSSPIDLLIVGKVNKEKLAKTIAEMEKEMGKEINFTLLNSSEFKYRREITDVFLYDVLEGEKIIVIDEIGL